jgi:hypothetical protein
MEFYNLLIPLYLPLKRGDFSLLSKEGLREIKKD